MWHTKIHLMDNLTVDNFQGKSHLHIPKWLSNYDPIFKTVEQGRLLDANQSILHIKCFSSFIA